MDIQTPEQMFRKAIEAYAKRIASHFSLDEKEVLLLWSESKPSPSPSSLPSHPEQPRSVPGDSIDKVVKATENLTEIKPKKRGRPKKEKENDVGKSNDTKTLKKAPSRASRPRCQFILKRGANAGSACGKPGNQNGFCSRHDPEKKKKKKDAPLPVPSDKPSNPSSVKPAPSKSEHKKAEKITSVKPPSYRIKKNQWGNYMHPVYKFVIEKNPVTGVKEVVGTQLDTGKVRPLTKNEIQQCVELRYAYRMPEVLEEVKNDEWENDDQGGEEPAGEVVDNEDDNEDEDGWKSNEDELEGDEECNDTEEVYYEDDEDETVEEGEEGEAEGEEEEYEYYYEYEDEEEGDEEGGDEEYEYE